MVHIHMTVSYSYDACKHTSNSTRYCLILPTADYCNHTLQDTRGCSVTLLTVIIHFSEQKYTVFGAIAS
jgi:hypothetical protein